MNATSKLEIRNKKGGLSSLGEGPEYFNFINIYTNLLLFV